MDDKAGAPRTFHKYRAELLEQAVRLEYLLDDALAAAYAQNFSTAQELRAEVLTRLPIPQRIRTLRRIMESRELSDRYPFVIPILDRVFKLRNVFAHNLSGGYDEISDAVSLVGMKDGEVATYRYQADYLRWLLFDQARAVERELGELFIHIAPADELWHES